MACPQTDASHDVIPAEAGNHFPSLAAIRHEDGFHAEPDLAALRSQWRI